jgi:ABC-2 type transport system permease protein
MSPAITLHTLRTRALGLLVGVVAIAAILVWSIDIYADIDVSFYYDLPPAVLDVMGLDPNGQGVGGIAYGAMLNLMGALTLAGLAISIGASGIAGEERDGTIGILLGNPVARATVMGSKVVALVVLVGVGGLVLWAGGVLAPDIVGVDVGDVQVTALVVHLTANALLWGGIAAAVGAATGNRTLAGGGTAGVMVLAYLAASLLPLFSWGEGAAKVSPWWWFSGHVPERNGIAWGWLAMQLAFPLALIALARWRLAVRDLRAGRATTSLLDRLRDHPRAAALLERVRGRARVSSLLDRVLTERRVLLIVVAYIMAVMGFYFPAMYSFLPDGFRNALDSFPDTLLAMVGQADMSTAAGFIHAEMFALTLPLVMIGLTATHGANALAGEERANTMDLLLANPVSRARLVVTKAVAMGVHAVGLGIAVGAGTAIGVAIFGLDVGYAGIAAASLQAVLLGTLFGALALLGSAVTGHVRRATAVAGAVALVAWFVNSFLVLSDSLSRIVEWSPFEWAVGNDPLVNGLSIRGVGLLAAGTVVLVLLAIPAFQRRDLRG